MTNFDYLKDVKDFSGFIDIAIAAERTFCIDYMTCVMNCRRAMEAAIKWMYSIDDELKVPYDDKLYSLMSTGEFRKIVDRDIWKKLDFIRRCGNSAAHSKKKISKDVAILCLKNLFCFIDFIYCCYGENYFQKEYDESLLLENNYEEKAQQFAKKVAEKEIELKTLIKENQVLKDKLSTRRLLQQSHYVSSHPLDQSEYSTRKLYIDSMLEDAGWVEGEDWFNEVKVGNMPNKSGIGYADYVLYDDAHTPLAIVEAKRTCADVASGREQARLYANSFEKIYKRRPVIFLTNGFTTRIIDGQYHEREVASIYSKRDLQKLFNLREERKSLDDISINKEIAGRYYQEAAIKAVCESFDKKMKRKALLVMATGSGKTRTIIELVDVLIEKHWIKNVLFLADRNSLVVQAKRSFALYLKNESSTNLVEDKENYNAHIVFSTYQTMITQIDSVKDNGKKLYTCGHFDLVICDEAHRSIYNKYKEIFDYFDAFLVGLTATPKDEIDKNTYDVFELCNRVPTYGYTLSQAINDQYLVDFVSIETKTKFLEEGINWDELSEIEKKEYEETFVDEDKNFPKSINSAALNTWVFNKDTIREVLHVLMHHGLKVDYGTKIGKTIIFAKNHNHAEEILKIFHEEYPDLLDYATVIDNKIKYAQSAIDNFSDPSKLPQIAISVDMLDTGIDVPEILNLVFFKKVMSKSKFWQMIGRGTRKCEKLIDGEDKKEFYIFDFCSNFEFFRVNKNAREEQAQVSAQESVFNLKFQIIYKLQDIAYQTEPLIEWRSNLIDDLSAKVGKLPKNNFAIRQHIKYVDIYSNPKNYQGLTFDECKQIEKEIAPFIPADDDGKALRFDALMYRIELAYLTGKSFKREKTDLFKKVKEISKKAVNIPVIEAQTNFINKLLHTSYFDDGSIREFEEIRKRLRGLIQYIDKQNVYYTDLDDDVLSIEWHESDLESEKLSNYKESVEYYIKQHEKDNPVILKLKTNKPLTKNDIHDLEKVLWDELGTKQDYYDEYGEKPLGEFVREIVGLDMSAAKEAFSQYLDERILTSKQIYFVNQVIEYIVKNGVMKDNKILQMSPFIDKGSLMDIFGDNTELFHGIQEIINDINQNANYM